jgi:hypothetical protein
MGNFLQPRESRDKTIREALSQITSGGWEKILVFFDSTTHPLNRWPLVECLCDHSDVLTNMDLRPMILMMDVSSFKPPADHWTDELAPWGLLPSLSLPCLALFDRTKHHGGVDPWDAQKLLRTVDGPALVDRALFVAAFVGVWDAPWVPEFRAKLNEALLDAPSDAATSVEAISIDHDHKEVQPLTSSSGADEVDDDTNQLIGR